jgi:hypothetical protein
MAPDTPFCPGANDRYSLRATALHELGHVIGLVHTDVRSALMFGALNPCDFTKDQFNPDDNAQFDFIYACEDDACQSEPDVTPNPNESSCKNGLDDDGDGLIDCDDPDCMGKGFCR